MLQRIVTSIKTYRYLFLLYLLVAFLLIANALFEMRQSRNELLELMRNQSEATLHSVIMASENLIKNNVQGQKIIENHLARILQTFYALSIEERISTREIEKTMRRANIDGLLFLDSLYTPFLLSGQFKQFSLDQLNHLLDKALELRAVSGDTLFWQERWNDAADTSLFRVGCMFTPRGEILFLIGRATLKNVTSQQADFGSLIRSLATEVPNIIFLALQDSTNIIAAAGKLEYLAPSEEQTILQHATQSNPVSFKILDFDSVRIFEADHPFSYRQNNIGLFRLGLSSSALESINQRIYRRLMVLSFILITLALLMVTFTFFRQRYDILHKQYTIIETYSSNIIENVSDAIIVSDSRTGIKIFNRSAEQLFDTKRDRLLGKPLERLLDEPIRQRLSEQPDQIHEVPLVVNNVQKTVLVSQSRFLDSEGHENSILVLRDITRQKQFEEHLKRQEQLTAIGQLAAGVAHEIRNPLNSISTIVQQLKKDFKPQEDQSLYEELMDIVYTEVKRINQKINEFLRFSRPEPVRPSKFQLGEWLNSIVAQYQPTFSERQVTFKLNMHWDGTVFWDANQMRDVMSNLIQNALDAMENQGTLSIEVLQVEDKIQINVTDSGKGIPPDQKEKIFNLYFTTKASGTGIGLSLVQRIVFEHQGLIQVDSESGRGTTFSLLLPREIPRLV